MTQLKFGILPLSALALASASTFTLAEPMEGMEEVEKQRTPASSLSVGLGYSRDDLTLLGRYNGRSDNGTFALLDFDFNRRDDETGTWTQISGRNVGLSNRDLRFEQNRQGDWNYFIEFNQLDSVNPYLYTTDLTGIGSDTQALGGPTISPQFSQERKNVKIGMGKHLTKEAHFTLSYRQEQKEGNKAWGADRDAFIVEPIDYRTRELDAKLDYTTDALQLRGGYLLSLFDNPTESVSLTDGDRNPITATPPDNKSHNLYLSGGYKLSETTRASFKLSKVLDLQDETFFIPNTSSPTRTSLDGEIDTTRVNLGIVSRVMPQLTLKAKLRYDDRDDKTPQSVFISPDRLNQLTSRTTSNGNLDAIYRLQPGMTLTAGIDHEKWKRNVTDEPNMAKREKTDETTLRLGARKSLSDTLNGSIRLSHSDRDGSVFIPGAAAPFFKVNPIQWSDRQRNKLRLALDWYATEQLSVQFVTEGTDDSYSLQGLGLGPKDGQSAMVSVDAGYALSDEWSLSAWVSANQTKLDSSTNNFSTRGAGSDLTWAGFSKDKGHALGFGIKGEPAEEIKVGGHLQYSKDRSQFDSITISDNGPGLTALDPIDDITYKQVSLKLFGEYAIDEQQGVRLDYQYDRIENDDWTWNGFTGYASTSVTQLDKESNHFVGLSYYYRGW